MLFCKVHLPAYFTCCHVSFSWIWIGGLWSVLHIFCIFQITGSIPYTTREEAGCTTSNQVKERRITVGIKVVAGPCFIEYICLANLTFDWVMNNNMSNNLRFWIKMWVMFQCCICGFWLTDEVLSEWKELLMFKLQSEGLFG